MITSDLLCRYMYRRCIFLDNLPGFNFNVGFGVMIGKEITKTTKLGSTLLEAMLREVKTFCDPKVNQNWTQRPHQQVNENYKVG